MRPFLEAIQEKVLILDGAMGTMLQERGLKPGQSPEELNLTMPEVVASVHRDYVEAGADIIITNTFGGSRFKLSHYGLEGRLAEINARAVEIARKEAEGLAYVGASIGPTGQFVEPLGEIPFDGMKAAFREQAAALVDAGADLISLETFLDIKECRAALIAIREVSGTIPVIAMLTFDDNGRSVLGTPPESAAHYPGCRRCRHHWIQLWTGGGRHLRYPLQDAHGDTPAADLPGQRRPAATHRRCYCLPRYASRDDRLP